MQREVTLAQVFCWMLALGGGIAALYWACLLVLANREQRAAVIATGGLALVLWAAFHLTDRQSQHG